MSDDLRGALVTNFGGADSVGVAGAANSGAAGAAGAGGNPGAAGRGGAGNAGSANAGSGNAGSANSGGGAAGGGGDDPPPGGSGGGQVCDAYNTVFLEKCAGGSCHGDGAANGVSAGEEAPTAADLVDVPSRNGAECGSLVDSGDIRDSVILQMLTGQQGPTCSPVPMPLGNDDLPPDELECVTEYLQALADN